MEFIAPLSEWFFLLALAYGAFATTILCTPGGQKALGVLVTEVVRCCSKRHKEAPPERSGARNC